MITAEQPVCLTCASAIRLPYRRTGQAKYCNARCYWDRPRKKERSTRAKCHPDRPHAARGLCETCYSVAHRTENAENYQRARLRYQLKKCYALALEDYEARVEACSGLCEICGRPPSTGRLVVDHDHATGAVRGLLCQACNTALGMLDDDTERMESAAAYIRRSRA